MEALISMGHPPATVWKYTPRQLAGFLFIASKRRQRERKEDLSQDFLAARGDVKEVRRRLKEVER